MWERAHCHRRADRGRVGGIGGFGNCVRKQSTAPVGAGCNDRRMLVHELRYPGSRPVGLDSEAAHALTCLLGLMESGVAEAAVSLHFFEQAASDVRSHRPQPPSPTGAADPPTFDDRPRDDDRSEPPDKLG